MKTKPKASAVENDATGVSDRVTNSTDSRGGERDDAIYTVRFPKLSPEDAWVKPSPVEFHFPSAETAVAMFSSEPSGGGFGNAVGSHHPGPVEAADVVRGVLGQLADALKKVSSAGGEATHGATVRARNPDDALVHQDSEMVPDRELFLRLARDGAFPSRKHGKKVFARWGDVRSAFCGPAEVEASDPPTVVDAASQHDHQLYRELLITPTGKGRR